MAENATLCESENFGHLELEGTRSMAWRRHAPRQMFTVPIQWQHSAIDVNNRKLGTRGGHA